MEVRMGLPPSEGALMTNKIAAANQAVSLTIALPFDPHMTHLNSARSTHSDQGLLRNRD